MDNGMVMSAPSQPVGKNRRTFVILGIVATVIIIACVAVSAFFSNQSSQKAAVSAAFNKYANYILFETDSEETPDMENAKRIAIKKQITYLGNTNILTTDTKIFLDNASQLLTEYEEMYAKNYKKSDDFVAIQKAALDSLKLYVENYYTIDQVASDMQTKNYNTEVKALQEIFAPLLESGDENLQEYANNRLDSYKKIASVYSKYKAAGCFANSKKDNDCLNTYIASHPDPNADGYISMDKINSAIDSYSSLIAKSDFAINDIINRILDSCYEKIIGDTNE